MQRATKSSTRFRWSNCALGAGLLLLAGFANSAHASDYQNLPVVKPIVSCDKLAAADLAQAVGTSVTIKSAARRDTEKAKYSQGNRNDCTGGQL